MLQRGIAPDNTDAAIEVEGPQRWDGPSQCRRVEEAAIKVEGAQSADGSRQDWKAEEAAIEVEGAQKGMTQNNTERRRRL